MLCYWVEQLIGINAFLFFIAIKATFSDGARYISIHRFKEYKMKYKCFQMLCMIYSFLYEVNETPEKDQSI